MKTRPLITYKEHFFRKGDKVRIMWNKELKEQGYDPYFNEDGDLMDGELKNMVLTAYEVEYVGTCFEIINTIVLNDIKKCNKKAAFYGCLVVRILRAD